MFGDLFNAMIDPAPAVKGKKAAPKTMPDYAEAIAHPSMAVVSAAPAPRRKKLA